MRQAIYRLDHDDFMGQSSYTTAWRMGDRIYVTHTCGRYTTPVEALTYSPRVQSVDTVTLLMRTFFYTAITRVA